MLLLLLVNLPIALFSQSKIQDLYQQLDRTKDPREKMRLNYELSSLNLIRKPSVATFQANQAYNLAQSLDDSYYLRKSAVLLGKSFINQSDNSAAIKWLKTGENLAKINKDLSLLIEAATLQSGIEIRNNNYKKAYEINLNAINYLKKHKNKFQNSAPSPNTNSAASNEVKILKSDQIKLKKENDELITQNSVLNEELLRLQYELAEKQLLVESAKKDSQIATINLDSNRSKYTRDSLIDRIPEFTNYNKSSREQLFSWLSAILGLLALGLLTGMYFLNKRKQIQKDKFADALIKKERLINNYREEIEEQESIRNKSIIGSRNGAKVNKIDQLTMLIVDFGSKLEFSDEQKTEKFISFYNELFNDLKSLLSQYPSVFYVKKIGSTFIFATGVKDLADNPDQLVLAAKDIQSYMLENPELKQHLKLGIHSGPVFLSTIDYNTESLDILGQTFDQCAWIQSIAKEGQILISKSSKELLGRPYQFELIGKKSDWTGQEIELYELK